MTFNEYQQLAARTIRKDLTATEVNTHGLFCMAAEVGEVLGLYQKVLQGHKLDQEHLKKELGDCLWAISEVATSCGFSLDEIAEINIEKLKKRYPEGFEVERSFNRKEGDI